MRACTLCHSVVSLWDPMNCSPPGSPVYGIFQARLLERVATSYSMRSFQPRAWTHISCIDGFFTTELPGKSLVHYNCNYLSGKQTAIYMHTLISQWIFPNVKSSELDAGNVPTWSNTHPRTWRKGRQWPEIKTRGEIKQCQCCSLQENGK